MGNAKSNTKPKIIRTENGNLLRKDGEIASEFNRHFAAVGEKLAQRFDKNKIAQLHRRRRTLPRITDSVVFDSVDEQEMKSVIDNLDVGKSAGHDGLPAKAVKVCRAILAPFLCRIINTSFVTGVYPDAFKIARVTPIHKTGD
jgi:hypothetical protein